MAYRIPSRTHEHHHLRCQGIDSSSTLNAAIVIQDVLQLPEYMHTDTFQLVPLIKQLDTSLRSSTSRLPISPTDLDLNIIALDCSYALELHNTNARISNQHSALSRISTHLNIP